MKPTKRKTDRIETPAELIEELMEAARSFYGDCPDKWFQEQRFVKANVVTWPANHMWEKYSVALRPERYRAVILEVFLEIKRHSKTAPNFMAGYLASCVQNHFKIHGEEYYNECKAVGGIADGLLKAVKGIPVARAERVVENLAQVHKALVSGARRKKQAVKPAKQLSLL